MSNAPLRRRLDRIEAAVRPPVGCATCRDWHAVVLVGEDGLTRPEKCPDCGRVVPVRERVYVGVRLADV